jgi:type III secretion system SsaH family protein
MTLADQTPSDGVGQWLDAPARQRIVELAIAGAHHGMRAQARVILGALPSLVPDRETREWLHVALLIALGDTCAARAYLTDATATGHSDDAAADALARWLKAMEARHAHSHSQTQTHAHADSHAASPAVSASFPSSAPLS